MKISTTDANESGVDFTCSSELLELEFYSVYRNQTETKFYKALTRAGSSIGISKLFYDKDRGTREV